MDELEFRLECLRLAHPADLRSEEARATIERARAYADFVLSRRDAEIIRAATDFAEKINAK
jgi:hypothetical protein